MTTIYYPNGELRNAENYILPERWIYNPDDRTGPQTRIAQQRQMNGAQR